MVETPVGPFPECWRPAPVPAARLERLLELAHRVENRDHAAVRAFFAETGRVIGPLDVHGAAGGNGVEVLVEHMLSSEVLAPPGLNEAERLRLIQALVSGELAPGHQAYAVRLLEVDLDQKHLTDLIYWPSEERPPTETLRLAATHRGTALVPYVDPMCSPADPGTVLPLPPRVLLMATRALVVELVSRGEIDLSGGEAAVVHLCNRAEGIRAGADLAEALEAPESGVADVYADDDTLDMRVRSWRTAIEMVE